MRLNVFSFQPFFFVRLIFVCDVFHQNLKLPLPFHTFCCNISGIPNTVIYTTENVVQQVIQITLQVLSICLEQQQQVQQQQEIVIKVSGGIQHCNNIKRNQKCELTKIVKPYIKQIRKKQRNKEKMNVKTTVNNVEQRNNKT